MEQLHQEFHEPKSREALRAEVLEAQDHIVEMHQANLGSPTGSGLMEALAWFSPELMDFLANADNVLPLSPEDGKELTQLIGLAGAGVLREKGHKVDLEKFVDLLFQFESLDRSKKPEQSH